MSPDTRESVSRRCRRSGALGTAQPIGEHRLVSSDFSVRRFCMVRRRPPVRRQNAALRLRALVRPRGPASTGQPVHLRGMVCGPSLCPNLFSALMPSQLPLPERPRYLPCTFWLLTPWELSSGPLPTLCSGTSSVSNWTSSPLISHGLGSFSHSPAPPPSAFTPLAGSPASNASFTSSDLPGSLRNN